MIPCSASLYHIHALEETFGHSNPGADKVSLIHNDSDPEAGAFPNIVYFSKNGGTASYSHLSLRTTANNVRWWPCL